MKGAPRDDVAFPDPRAVAAGHHEGMRSPLPDTRPEPAPAQRRFDPRIVACYLYPITRYGYPPPAEGTERYVEELAALGFRGGVQS